MKKHFPNILTSLNLFSGCVATVMVFRGHFEWAAYLVFIAAIFDLLDGMIARRMNVLSAFGKELDSLADLVTFGLVPGAVLFRLLQFSSLEAWVPQEEIRRLVQFLPFAVTVFSALRLAKFNLDTRQTDSFIGLPTPANTLWIISLPLIVNSHTSGLDAMILHPVVLLSMTVISCFLLVSEIPLFSLKFKSFGWKENFYAYVLLLFSAIAVPVFSFAALPLIIVFYVLLSIIKNFKTSNS